MTSRFAPAFLVAAMLPGVAHPATSDWLETQGARIRLVVEDRAAAGGVLKGALEIELEPGWKTYWRDPGDAGVPPQIDVTASTNLSAASIDFPPPKRFHDAYGAWAGYKGRVALPVRFDVPDPARFSAVEADVFLGVCDEVCVPVQMRLSATGDEPGSDAIVDAAFAALPAPADATLLVQGAKDRGDRLFLDVPAAGAGSELFVVTPVGWRLGAPELSSAGAPGFSIPVVSRPQAVGPVALDYTLVSGGRAVAGTVPLK